MITMFFGVYTVSASFKMLRIVVGGSLEKICSVQPTFITFFIIFTLKIMLCVNQNA